MDLLNNKSWDGLGVKDNQKELDRQEEKKKELNILWISFETLGVIPN